MKFFGRFVLSIWVLTSLSPLPEAQQARPKVPRLPGFSLKDLSGRKMSLDDLKGRKATLLNFFYPGCGPCNAEMPYLKALYEKYRRQGFELVSINVLPEQNGLLKSWAERGGYTHPILQAPAGDATLMMRYGVREAPTNYLLNGDTWPVRRWRGYAPGYEDRMESEIRTLLGMEEEQRD